MRQSDEKSIEQARKSDKIASGQRSFRVAATESRVFPGEASSEIRYFSEDQEFNFKQPELLLSRYRTRFPEIPVAEREHLRNTPSVYELPYGFLSGLSKLIASAVDLPSYQFAPEGRPRLRVTFVYNACPYRLEILRIRDEEKFRPTSEAPDMRLPPVARVEFRCTNTVKHTRTDFELWLPRNGELQGIPVRIQLQPRWWLRLRLDLDLQRSEPGQHSVADTAGIQGGVKGAIP